MFIDTISKVLESRGHATVTYPEHFKCDGDYLVMASWPLDDDPDRPNKRSKKLEILITQEACEDFRDAPEDRQRAALERLRKNLSDRLSDFDPNHNAPIRVGPPIERWEIHTGDIN